MFCRLLAIGGRDGGSCLSVVEQYNPSIDVWTTCAPMNRRRAGVAAVECNGFVYAVGGHDCSAPLSQCSPGGGEVNGVRQTVATVSNNTSAVLLDCVERLVGV